MSPAGNAGPTIGTLTDSPDPVNLGASLTLTATKVADSNAALIRVEFYRDTNNNGVLEPATDQLLGADTNGADGWSLVASTAGFSGGTNRYFARGRDGFGVYGAAKATTGVVNAPPTVASLSDSPDPVVKGQTLTLTAGGVADPGGTISAVEFYRDSNNNGVLDIGTDTLLGTDTKSTGGWSVAVSTSAFPTGAARYFARAKDNGGLFSAPATTTGAVNATGAAALALSAAVTSPTEISGTTTDAPLLLRLSPVSRLVAALNAETGRFRLSPIEERTYGGLLNPADDTGEEESVVETLRLSGLWALNDVSGGGAERWSR